MSTLAMLVQAGGIGMLAAAQPLWPPASAGIQARQDAQKLFGAAVAKSISDDVFASPSTGTIVKLAPDRNCFFGAARFCWFARVLLLLRRRDANFLLVTIFCHRAYRGKKHCGDA